MKTDSEKVSLANPESKQIIDVEGLRLQIIQEVQTQLDKRLDDNEKNQFVQKEEYEEKLKVQIEKLQEFQDEKIATLQQFQDEKTLSLSKFQED